MKALASLTDSERCKTPLLLGELDMCPSPTAEFLLTGIIAVLVGTFCLLYGSLGRKPQSRSQGLHRHSPPLSRAVIYPGANFLKQHGRKPTAYRLDFLYCGQFCFPLQVLVNLPRLCKRCWIRRLGFQEDRTEVLYIDLSYPAEGCTGPAVNPTEVNCVLSSCKRLPLWLTPLPNSKLSLSLLARGCAHGLWHGIIKTPISESWLLSPVRKSIALQQNASLLIANCRFIASQLQRTHRETEPGDPWRLRELPGNPQLHWLRLCGKRSVSGSKVKTFKMAATHR